MQLTDRAKVVHYNHTKQKSNSDAAQEQLFMANQIEHIHGHSIRRTLNGEKMNQQPLTLQVVIAKHCQQCRESLRVAEALQREFPALAVRVTDLDAPGALKPAAVFAVPCFLLNERVVSLGNPEVEELGGTIRLLLQARETVR